MCMDTVKQQVLKMKVMKQMNGSKSSGISRCNGDTNENKAILSDIGKTGYQTEHKDDKNHDKEKGTRKADLYLALILCSVVVVIFSVSFISVQYLSGAVPENELNSWRFLVSAITAAPFLLRSGSKIVIPRAKSHLFVLICFLTVAYNSTLYTASIYAPVGTVSGIFTGTNLIFISLITICIESKFKPKMYIGPAISFVGIILLVQPEFLMFPAVTVRNTSWESPCLLHENITKMYLNETERLQESQSQSNTWLGYVLALGSGLITGLYAQVGKYYVTDSDAFALALWRSLAATLISLILMLIFEEPVWPTDVTCILALFGHALAVSISSLSLLVALKHLSLTITMIVPSLNLVCLVILQYTLMKDIMPAKENWIEVLGAVLSVIGSIGGTVYELKVTHYNKKTEAASEM